MPRQPDVVTATAVTHLAADATAVATLIAAWFGYPRLLHLLGRRRVSINHLMVAVRIAWMRRMLDRDPRITDAALIGHVIHSVAFFASGTMIVLGLLLTALAAADRIAEIAGPLAVGSPLDANRVRLILGSQVALFVGSFLSFTWALRQFNYGIALVGAAPLPPVPPDRAERLAEALGRALSLASASFNAGLRGYYFALAVLAWFVSPWLVPASVATAVILLARRQISSKAHAALADAAAALGDADVREVDVARLL